MLKITIKVTVKFIIVIEKKCKKIYNGNDVTSNTLLSNLSINKYFSKVTKLLGKIFLRYG